MTGPRARSHIRLPDLLSVTVAVLGACAGIVLLALVQGTHAIGYLVLAGVSGVASIVVRLARPAHDRVGLRLRLVADLSAVSTLCAAAGFGIIAALGMLPVVMLHLRRSGSQVAGPATATAVLILTARHSAVLLGWASSASSTGLSTASFLVGVGLVTVTIQLAGWMLADGERARAALAHHAAVDPLTRLPNRAAFLDRLGQAVARSARHGAPLAVLFLDLDGFKAVNDTLGHDVGDDLLRSVSHRLAGCIRAEETVARLGGDEFTILVEDLDDQAAAVRVAERVSDAINEPFIVRGHSVCVAASIGIAVSTGADRPEELLRQADTAMYLAKRGPRDYELYCDETEMRLIAVRENAGRIRVLLADDTASIRTLMRFQLEVDGVCEVVGEASDGAEAVALVGELHPDVVLLDLAMPVMDGLEAIPAIRQNSPGTKIVVLSGFESAQMAEDAFFLGADAYLEKGAESEDIVALVKAQVRLGEASALPAPAQRVDFDASEARS